MWSRICHHYITILLGELRWISPRIIWVNSDRMIGRDQYCWFMLVTFPWYPPWITVKSQEITKKNTIITMKSPEITNFITMTWAFFSKKTWQAINWAAAPASSATWRSYAWAAARWRWMFGTALMGNPWWSMAIPWPPRSCSRPGVGTALEVSAVGWHLNHGKFIEELRITMGMKGGWRGLMVKFHSFFGQGIWDWRRVGVIWPKHI